jgi:hypothetical protein
MRLAAGRLPGLQTLSPPPFAFCDEASSRWLNLGLLSRLLAESAHAGRELNSRVLEDRRCSEDQVNLGTVPKFFCRELAAFDCGQNARGELVGEFGNPVEVRSLGTALWLVKFINRPRRTKLMAITAAPAYGTPSWVSHSITSSERARSVTQSPA